MESFSKDKRERKRVMEYMGFIPDEAFKLRSCKQSEENRKKFGKELVKKFRGVENCSVPNIPQVKNDVRWL